MPRLEALPGRFLRHGDLRQHLGDPQEAQGLARNGVIFCWENDGLTQVNIIQYHDDIWVIWDINIGKYVDIDIDMELYGKNGGFTINKMVIFL